jgi:hypothetical protein
LEKVLVVEKAVLVRKVGESEVFVRSNVASLKQFRVHPTGVSLHQLKQI